MEILILESYISSVIFLFNFYRCPFRFKIGNHTDHIRFKNDNSTDHTAKLIQQLYQGKEGLWVKKVMPNLTTLDAVPPGQQARRIKPTEIDGGSPRDLLMIAPSAGMMVYWATQPNSICSKHQEWYTWHQKQEFTCWRKLDSMQSTSFSFIHKDLQGNSQTMKKKGYF